MSRPLPFGEVARCLASEESSAAAARGAGAGELRTVIGGAGAVHVWPREARGGNAGRCADRFRAAGHTVTVAGADDPRYDKVLYGPNS